MFDAKWAPVAIVGSRAGGYLGGVVLSGFATLSPSTLASVYPSKSFIQLYHAVSILPSLLAVLLWWLMLGKSPLVALTGTLRIITGAFAVYITAEDSLSWHGNFAALHVAVTLGWMWLVTARYQSNTQTTRRYISIAYLVALLMFMHFQGHFLTGGNGYYKVLCLRLVQIGLDLAFEALAFTDFEGFGIYVGYKPKFEV